MESPLLFPRQWLPGVLVLCFLSLSLSFSQVPAATVTLKNGSTVEGLIAEDVPGEYIVVRTPFAELRFPYDQIESIDRESTQGVEEQLGDQLARQGLYKEALERYLEAKESGDATAKIDEKIQRMRGEIEAQELAQYSERIREIESMIDVGFLDDAAQRLQELYDSVKEESVRKRVRELFARVHYQRAQRAMDVVDYTEAEKQLNIAIGYDPDFAEAHIELGDLYNSRQLGKERALQEYLTALSLDNGELKASERNRIRWNIARISHEMENWEQALEYYLAVYRSNPRFDPRLLDALRETFLRRANALAAESSDRAIELLREALSLFPADAEMRYRVAQLLAQQEKCDQVLEELQKLFEIDGRYPNAHFLAANCLLEQGKILEAREQLIREVQAHPDHVEALVKLGTISLEGGDFPSAETYLRQALSVDPARVPALVGMARVKRRQGNLDAARRFVETVLEANPQNREGNLEMGLILKEEKKYDEALRFFGKVIQGLQDEQENEGELTEDQKKLMADALNRRAEVYILQEQTRTARNDLDEAVKYAPDYALTYYNIGQSYEKEATDFETLQEAEKNILKARELAPKNEQFAQGLGILYHQYMSQQDIPEAQKREYLRKALKNYKEYLDLGGGDVENVKQWIQEIEAQ